MLADAELLRLNNQPVIGVEKDRVMDELKRRPVHLTFQVAAPARHTAASRTQASLDLHEGTCCPTVYLASSARLHQVHPDKVPSAMRVVVGMDAGGVASMVWPSKVTQVPTSTPGTSKTEAGDSSGGASLLDLLGVAEMMGPAGVARHTHTYT